MTPSELVQQIRNEIFESTQLTASAGNLNIIKVLIVHLSLALTTILLLLNNGKHQALHATKHYPKSVVILINPMVNIFCQ
jgi:hypothetical protein